MAIFSGAMNLKTKAVGQFCNFKFNSFCVVNGKLFGASTDGLFQITGQTDAGQQIDASLETPVSGWGSDRIKRVRYALLSAELHGRLTVEILDQNDTILGSEEIDGTSNGAKPGVFRVSFDRGTNGHYVKFKISNMLGSFVAIDALAAYFIARPRGTSKNS